MIRFQCATARMFGASRIGARAASAGAGGGGIGRGRAVVDAPSAAASGA